MQNVRWTDVMTLLAAPCAVVAAAPLLSAAHWVFDLLACFVVQAGAALLGAGIFFTVRQKWVRAGLCAGGAIVAGVAAAPDWLHRPDRGPSVDNTPQLVVVTVNLLSSNDEGPARVLEVVRSADADVVWFSEYTPQWQRSLRPALAAFPHRIERPDIGSFGAALYARHPLEDAAMVPGGHTWSPFGRATLRSPYGLIGLLGVHPPPPQPNRRGVAERDRGLAAIPRLLADLPPRCIVLGDFNATPWNDAFVRLRRDADLRRGSTTWWLPTWPDPMPALLRTPIDHVLTRGALTVTSAALGPSIGSDHRPLVAQVRVER
ncbi:MAG: endonuclease/exonuclease/phosphatase family protein [Planctomycetota bacterium]